MITNVLEFQKALEELQSLEVRLARINQDHPLGSKGFTKVAYAK